MFLEHFGSKKSNHCVFSLFFAHPGCDNCVEGSDRNSKAKDDIACPVFDRQLLCISHRQSSFRYHLTCSDMSHLIVIILDLFLSSEAFRIKEKES